MLYNLLVPWASEWTALNVFRYITFRSMAALITALVLSILHRLAAPPQMRSAHPA